MLIIWKLSIVVFHLKTFVRFVRAEDQTAGADSNEVAKGWVRLAYSTLVFYVHHRASTLSVIVAKLMSVCIMFTQCVISSVVSSFHLENRPRYMAMILLCFLTFSDHLLKYVPSSMLLGGGAQDDGNLHVYGITHFSPHLGHQDCMRMRIDICLSVFTSGKHYTSGQYILL